MIRLFQDRTEKVKMWCVTCPFCFCDLIFYNASPIICNKCKEELPDYSGLMESISERKQHYLLGKAWEMWDDKANT